MYAKELIQRISLYGFKQTKQKQKQITKTWHIAFYMKGEKYIFMKYMFHLLAFHIVLTQKC